jgi:hypothetical protein
MASRLRSPSNSLLPVRAKVIFVVGKTTTFTVDLRVEGLVAPMLLDRLMDEVAFAAYMARSSSPCCGPKSSPRGDRNTSGARSAIMPVPP